jgi:hypothetical protein
MSAIDIHKDIEATFGQNAIGYSTVTRYLRDTQVTHDSESTPTSIEEECQRLIDKATLLALAEEPFPSVRRIASKALIPGTAVYPHLVGPLGMIVKDVRWVIHWLSPQQKVSRVQKAQELLPVHKSAKHNSWENIITLDESYFAKHTSFEQMWFPREEARNSRVPYDQL